MLPKPPSGCTQVGTGIKADDVTSCIDNLFCEHTITRADVQNLLVRNRREQLKYLGAEIGNETRVLFISRGVPGLWVHGLISGRYTIRSSLPEIRAERVD